MKNKVTIEITEEQKILLYEAIESRLQELNDYPASRELSKQIKGLVALSEKLS